MLIKPEDFIAKIPEIIKGKSQLSAVFTSYNSIQGYRGQVDTGKQGLSVYSASETENGHRERVSEWSSPSQMEMRASICQQNVEQCLLGEHPEVVLHENLFFMIYLGLSGFSEATHFTESLRDDFPDAYIATLTCDCGLKDKFPSLQNLKKHGFVDEAIVTGQCGGSMEMARILEALIEAWPN